MRSASISCVVPANASVVASSFARRARQTIDSNTVCPYEAAFGTSIFLKTQLSHV
jgi:hypothetical protein